MQEINSLILPTVFTRNAVSNNTINTVPKYSKRAVKVNDEL